MGEKIKAYMMVGLPGAGKDTWIKENLPEDICIVGRDEERARLGFGDEDNKMPGDLKDEVLIVQEWRKRMVQCAKECKNFVINDINIMQKGRKFIKGLLKDYEIYWTYVVVTTSDINVNKKRRKGQLDPEFIESAAESYQPPTPDEYDEIIYVNT